MKSNSAKGKFALVLTAALALAMPITAAAAPAASPLPPSAVLTAAELPAVGGLWNEVKVFQRPSGRWTFPPCWPTTQLFGETDGLDGSSGAPSAGRLGWLFENHVLRFSDRARADAVVAQWRKEIQSCEIPVGPHGGELYIKDVRKVTAVGGVDVWGYDFGASLYQFSPNTNYAQFFVVQKDNLVSFVSIVDYATKEPHPPVNVEATVAAVQRRLNSVK